MNPRKLRLIACADKRAFTARGQDLRAARELLDEGFLAPVYEDEGRSTRYFEITAKGIDRLDEEAARYGTTRAGANRQINAAYRVHLDSLAARYWGWNR